MLFVGSLVFHTMPDESVEQNTFTKSEVFLCSVIAYLGQQ